jgi:hypothetical protein
VCTLMRVHAFLETWGLINFSVEPYLKPHKFSLLKEAGYGRVLINAANKHQLTKNEGVGSNLFDRGIGQEVVVEDNGGTLRKLNLLTAK